MSSIQKYPDKPKRLPYLTRLMKFMKNKRKEFLSLSPVSIVPLFCTGSRSDLMLERQSTFSKVIGQSF